jgi:hypothetical protein
MLALVTVDPELEAQKQMDEVPRTITVVNLAAAGYLDSSGLIVGIAQMANVFVLSSLEELDTYLAGS